MFDLLDLFLLRRGIPADDRTIDFRRIDGNPHSKVIYFLPWHTPFSFARQFGFIALDYLACYEIPPALVSSEPDFCVKALQGLVTDAEALLGANGVQPTEAIIVGLSVGNFPATYLANRIGARLCSVAPADRADLMLWQSPAARIVKRRAVQKGYSLSRYTEIMAGYHPAHNLAGVGANSVFLFGWRDPFVPAGRRRGQIAAIKAHTLNPQIIKLDAGHFKTLLISGRYQRAIVGATPSPRRSWSLRVPALTQIYGTPLPTAADSRMEDEAQASALATAEQSPR